MPLFRICRYALIEQFDIVEAASSEEARALVDADKVDMTLADETAEYGPLAIYPEYEMEIGPDPLPLESVSKPIKQALILREALERTQKYAENELARMEENEFLPEDELVTEAIRSDVSAGRAALEATKEGA